MTRQSHGKARSGSLHPVASLFSRAAVAVAVLAAVVLVVGCRLGPNFKVPLVPQADQWREVEQKSFIGDPVDQTEWWKVFNDPVLNRLVEEAFQQNLTLQQASLRIVQARIRKTAAWMSRGPIYGASGSAMHVNMSETSKPDVDVTLPKVSVNIPPRLAGVLSQLPPLLQVSGKPEVKMSDSLNVYSASFDAAYELDFWGKKRRAEEAAIAELGAAYAGYDDMMISLAGEVATTYIQIRTLEQRIKVTRENVALQEKFTAITEEAFKNKKVIETDVLLARTFTGNTAAIIPGLENTLRQTENALCILLDRSPGDLRSELGESAIPSAPTGIAVGVPADLIRRRPDVRMMERMAHARCARIGVQKAKILPSFSLLGAIGLESTDSNRFFRSDSVTGHYGGAVKISNLLLYPVTVEMVRSADARFEEAMLQYRETVLNAAREVENAMTGFVKAQEQRAILEDASKACIRATEIALNAYKEGKVIVSVPLVCLGMQTNLQNQVLAAQGTAATNVIATYKALGGGWQIHEDRQLVPEEIRERMKERTDWWTFAGKYDLNTARVVNVSNK